MKTLHPDDPRLTAYALGELSSAETAEIGRLVSEDPELQQFVDETRALARSLETELLSDPAPELSPVNRHAIEEALRKRKVVHFPKAFWVATLAAAACLAFFALPSLRHSEKSKPSKGTDYSLAQDSPKPVSVLPEAVEKLETQPVVVAENDQPPASEDQLDVPATNPPLHAAYGTAVIVEAGSAPLLADNTTQPVQQASSEKLTQGHDMTGWPETKESGADGTDSSSPSDPSAGGKFNLVSKKIPLEKPLIQDDEWQSGFRADVISASDTNQVGGQKAQANTYSGATGTAAPTRRIVASASAPGTPAPVTAPTHFDGYVNYGEDLSDRGGNKGLEQRTVVAGNTLTPVFKQRMVLNASNTEAYDSIKDNDFIKVISGDKESSFSTFSIDVDTASYANVRRFLNEGQLPPPGAVRIEEMINYFHYDYPQPKGEDPFSINVNVTTAPWNSRHRLVRIGLMGKEIPVKERPACNLVFLLDVSGSMDEPNKLPLVKSSLIKLVDQLRPQDRVAIVVYAGASGMALPSTPASEKKTIRKAINELNPGGSTNGAAGIQLAYDIAKANFIKEGVNRVILATDGDFNVGVTSQDDLTALIEEKAKSGIFLTVSGFGMGNLKDSTLEKLADKGNGNYAYIDTAREADKVFVRQLSGTLVTIAKDVKIQIEFNPANVAAYRLVGYENRVLANRDFNDDTKDAGEIGSGHTVTALYEIVPAGSETELPETDALRYAPAEKTATPVVQSNELLLVKLRYKQPDGDTSKLLTFPVTKEAVPLARASADTRFSASVAAFGMILRNSPHKGNATFDMVESLAEDSMKGDVSGDRKEFLGLVRKAEELNKNR
jgi:Ca-activated chloride channel family protein